MKTFMPKQYCQIVRKKSRAGCLGDIFEQESQTSMISTIPYNKRK